MSELRKRDIAYCVNCTYRGDFSEGYLCNFLYLTGERRGRPAGVGCIRRVVAKANSGYREKICRRCGAVFIGNYRKNYCEMCSENMRAEHLRGAMHK